VATPINAGAKIVVFFVPLPTFERSRNPEAMLIRFAIDTPGSIEQRPG